MSLDALDDAVFKAMNDVGFPVAAVLEGIQAAREAGLPVKANMVVKKGVNDGQILQMARRFAGTGIDLRFIEFMDVGATNGWSMEHVLPSAEALAMVRSELELAPLALGAARVGGETSERWIRVGGDGRPDRALGEIGFVSSVTKAFCSDCSRARLSADGQVFTCLFANSGTDFRGLLRAGASDAEIERSARALWAARGDRYSELRGAVGAAGAGGRKVEMSFIGG